jgi:diguanylate cyclase (GGDEF)-like protein
VEQLEKELAEGDPHGDLALFFCDLDAFKPVNDARGHEAGDAVLVEVAARMNAVVRAHDLVARLGGDEFVVLIHGYEETAELELIARRLISSIGRSIVAAGVEVGVGVSIGIAIARDGDDADSLVVRADRLMYQAKAAGKGRFVLDRPPA